MNRAMFSGVAGLKTHQTKMDVIGNNIANVNTFGFKSQRAVFSDIFYQTIQGASAGTGNRGGTNPSSVGYGSQLASIQTQMSQSSMQSTGYGMDVAITGEGFFQVMDPDGNIFYTKAGIFDYDSNGYLVDVNGNFVLGAEGTNSDPDSKKIQLDNIGSVNPSTSSYEATINSILYTLKTSNTTTKGNVGVSFDCDESMTLGQKAKATIESTGSIRVTLNANEYFKDFTALNDAINDAITEANGGKPHPAGTFTLSSEAAKEKFTAAGAAGLSGAEICGTNFQKKEGTFVYTDGDVDPAKVIDPTAVSFFGDAGIQIKGTSKDFLEGSDVNTAVGIDDFKLEEDTTTGVITVTLTIDSKDFVGTVSTTNTSSGSLLLKSTSSGDVTISFPGYEKLKACITNNVDPLDSAAAINDLGEIEVYPSKASNDLGLSSSSFTLDGGTAGGPVTLDELTSISIGADGIISVTHPDMGTVAAGRISLANFANPAGLELNGSNYYSASSNSGEPQLCDPGSEGTGALKSNALEMSNVDLSAEFADMITTQRGFQANSRIITVSDTMLEELINLKR